MKLDFRHLFFTSLLVFLLVSETVLAGNYIVSGAPIPDANGLYVENGTSELTSKFTKGNWTLARTSFLGLGWGIFEGVWPPLSPMTYINAPNPSDLPPNDGMWRAEVPIPGLIITLAPASIPSLSTWGILIMLMLFIGIAIAVIRKSHFTDIGAQ
jgi:hypothetical protein